MDVHGDGRAPGDDDEPRVLAGRIAAALQGSGRSVAAAESVTGGHLAARLAAAPDAGDWFRGAVVAYTNDVKYSVLGVPRGPVITAACASDMAAGVAELLAADIAVSTTGVGGPGAKEGRPPGTVFIAIASPTTRAVREYHFDGEPARVVAAATAQALRDLADHCSTPPLHAGGRPSTGAGEVPDDDARRR